MAAGRFVEIRCCAARGRNSRTGVTVVASGDDSEEEKWERHKGVHAGYHDVGSCSEV
jgi:hypothetical protein